LRERAADLGALVEGSPNSFECRVKNTVARIRAALGTMRFNTSRLHRGSGGEMSIIAEFPGRCCLCAEGDLGEIASDAEDNDREQRAAREQPAGKNGMKETKAPKDHCRI